MLVEWGEWLPDQPALGNPGAPIIKNVMPVPGGYGPMGALTATTTALDEPCQGAATIRTIRGTATAFAGDKTKLYRRRAGAWTNVSAGAYATPEYEKWGFTRYLDDMVAVNGQSVVQRYNLKDNVNFEDVPGSPVARHAGVIGDFLMTAPVASDVHVKWCGSRDITEWTPTVRQAGEQRFTVGGKVMGIVGGEFGNILLQDGIIRATIIGGDAVFQFDLLEGVIGCSAAGSIVPVRDRIYYYSQEGFQVFDGVNSRNIGHGKVNDTFRKEVDFSYLDRMSAAYDPLTGCVVFAYPTSGPTLNKILIYNIFENRWSPVEQTVQVLVSDLSENTSIDDISGSIEVVTPSLDSPFWEGGTPRVAAFDSLNQQATFSGPALAPTLQTKEVAPSLDRRGYLQEVTPIIQSTNASITVQHRPWQSAALSTSGPFAQSQFGWTPIEPVIDDRFFRFQLDMPAGETFPPSPGVNITVAPGGRF